MARQYIPDGYAKLQWLLDDADTAHTSYVSLGVQGVSPSGFDGAATDDMIDAFHSAFHALLGDKLSCERVRAIIGAAAPPYLSLTKTSTRVDFDATSNSEPQVQALVHITTSTPGRKGRGAIYFPRPDGNQINSRGSLSDGYKTEFVTALGNWIEAVNALDSSWNAGFVFHSHPDDEPSSWTGGLVAPIIATQRRRLARGR